MTIDEQIAAIEEAIASGAKRVRFRSNGVEKEVEYPSFDQMKKAVEYLELKKAKAEAPLPRVGLAMFGRGN